LEKFYVTLSEKYERLLGFTDLKALYNPKAHQEYFVDKSIEDLYRGFTEFVEVFENTYKLNKKNPNMVLSKENFVEFLNIFGFGIENDQMFFEMVFNVFTPDLEKNSKKEKIKENNNYNSPQPTGAYNHQNKFEETKRYTKYSNDLKYKTYENDILDHKSFTQLKLNTNDKEAALVQNQYSRKIFKPLNVKDPFNKLKEKLRKRGIRGLMNLHKQFLLNCSNINTISFGDFVKVLKLQRIELENDEFQTIFEKSLINNQFLNFSAFIRNFKKILSQIRLEWVEKAFSFLDVESTEMLVVDDIKLKFDASSHPEVLSKIRSEDDVIVEFLDCFELNYNFLVLLYLIVNRQPLTTQILLTWYLLKNSQISMNMFPFYTMTMKNS